MCGGHLGKDECVLLVSSPALSDELRIDEGIIVPGWSSDSIVLFFPRLAARLSFPQHDGFFPDVN